MVTCEICKQEMKGLTLHLIKKHFITPEEYCKLFPGAKIFDDTCLNSDKRKAAYERLKGKPKSEEHRKALSNSRKKLTGFPGTIGWKHSDETKQKIRDKWNQNRERWSKSISDHYTPERRAAASRKQSEIIATRGYTLGRSINSLEQLVEEIITSLGYHVSRQVRSLQKIKEKYRYYDLYVQELNLIVEIDGEYWHKSSEKIDIDIEKETHVRNVMKQKFIRISDKDLSKSSDQTKYINSLLLLSEHEQIDHCNNVIRARQAALLGSEQIVLVSREPSWRGPS